MPKIEVYEEPFYALLGKRMSEQELVETLVTAKAELDGREPKEGLLKIELNDTNRPDLWSTAGLARELASHLNRRMYRYDFFSRPGELQQTAERVVEVDPALENIRPYITAFVAQGRAIDDPLLKDIIQSQEKLCWNYGQRRKAIAMGVYRTELMKFPVRYMAADPDETRFVPLEFGRELSLREILTEHPKGVEFGWIVKDFDLFPYLADREGGTLSFPPIINSARIGAVKVGDDSVFIELTGTEMDSLLLATSITVCDLADMGFRILPVRVKYPYDTPYGREVVTPFYFQRPQSVEASDANRLLGEELDPEAMVALLEKGGHTVERRGSTLTLFPPVFRNDFLHGVDVVEEIMICRGMESFEPVMPTEYTIGRFSEIEIFCRDVRDIMIGLGYQEMIYNYLGSKRDFIERMNVPEDGFIEISNPMTENYTIVRRSILPNLLASESASANAVYPHMIFETGKVSFKDEADNYGSKTRTYLAFLRSDGEAGFNDVTSHVSAVFYYLAREYTLEEADDPRFIKGRSARILYRGRAAGIMGEIQPDVLENWGIQMPCACAEIDLDLLIEPA
jgi:phenylalanyl-tRNA synthetase beta chain